MKVRIYAILAGALIGAAATWLANYSYRANERALIQRRLDTVVGRRKQ